MVRAGPRTNRTASRVLRYYQRFAYTSGQLLLGCLVVVLAALVTRGVDRRLRLDAALLAVATLAALVVASALSVFSYRYGFVAIVLLPAAAALAGAGLLRRQPSRSARTQTS
jgi:NhaP-type Na+/H+ or K+/H+ antiporter